MFGYAYSDKQFPVDACFNLGDGGGGGLPDAFLNSDSEEGQSLPDDPKCP